MHNDYRTGWVNRDRFPERERNFSHLQNDQTRSKARQVSLRCTGDFPSGNKATTTYKWPPTAIQCRGSDGMELYTWLPICHEAWTRTLLFLLFLRPLPTYSRKYYTKYIIAVMSRMWRRIHEPKATVHGPNFCCSQLIDWHRVGEKISLHGVQFRNSRNYTDCHYQVNWSPTDCHLLVALEQNLGGRRFEEDRGLETAATRRTRQQDIQVAQQYR